MNAMYNKYAHLLTDYCLNVQKGDRVYVRTTYLAEKLVQELMREVTKAGGHLITDIQFQGQEEIFYSEASQHQLEYVNPLKNHVIREFDKYLVIIAPFESNGPQKDYADKKAIARKTGEELSKLYMQRTGSKDMERSLCLFPTEANAKRAGMSLEDYEQFVFKGCGLLEENPKGVWLNVREEQQAVVDYLNRVDTVTYEGPGFSISYRCKDRLWINSDGRTNMPSGEVYTAPIEDSVNGNIKFSYDSLYMGREVSGVNLTVKDGKVVKWTADKGQDFLDYIFSIPGARIFGEAAIGTNYHIQRPTKNILFDEKMGGSVHMAIGQSYPQCGGSNTSSVHWDMITDMRQGGAIYADGVRIYENGKFLIG